MSRDHENRLPVKLNCWEVKKCGREPGGAKVTELGICPAAVETDFNGVFGGTNSGRSCWVVAGTFCKGQIQGTFAQKFKNCSQCDFYKRVMEEEGELFHPADVVLRYIDKTHEHRVEERTRELKEAREELERAYDDLEDANKTVSLDIDLAARIQASFFVQKAPVLPDWDIALVSRPAAKVSGDFYSFYQNKNTLRGLSLFDVSGHGMGPGLLTLLAQSVISERVHAGDSGPLGQIMVDINKKLIQELEASLSYLTGVILRFNGSSAEYANAGHTEILLRRAGPGRAVTVGGKNTWPGPVLGMKGAARVFPVLSFTLEKNDLLLLYTDCLVESQNSGGEEYGLKRLGASFAALNPGESAQNLAEHILRDFYSFTGKTAVRDDLTLILLKRTS